MISPMRLGYVSPTPRRRRLHPRPQLLGGVRTIFPTQLGMAASWDRELIEKVGRVTAVEVAATGIHWTFSPVPLYRPRPALGPRWRDLQ